MDRFTKVLQIVDIVTQTMPSVSAFTFAIIKVFIISLQPFYLFKLYGLSGLVLLIFGSRSTWLIEAHLLGEVDDSEAMQFKKSVQDDCTMISVAVSPTLTGTDAIFNSGKAAIVAQIAITGLSLENLSRTHWVARAFLLYSLISSLMAVYYATTQQRIMGRLLRASQVRGWIRGQVPPRMNLPMWKVIHGSSKPDPQYYQPQSRDRDEIVADVIKKCFTPSVTAVITISAPQILLSSSLMSLLLGVGVYFGFVWTRNLDTEAGFHDSRNIEITYIITVVVCFLVYSVSRLIVDDDTRPEHLILHENLADYMVKHPDIGSRWFGIPNNNEQSVEEQGE